VSVLFALPGMPAFSPRQELKAIEKVKSNLKHLDIKLN
jgi:hypothetical protein